MNTTTSTDYTAAPATALVATVCCACGRPLVDADSVTRGMGPECAEKYGCAIDAVLPEAAAMETLACKLTVTMEDLWLGDEAARAMIERVRDDVRALNAKSAAARCVAFIAARPADAHAVALAAVVAEVGYGKLAAKVLGRLPAFKAEKAEAKKAAKRAAIAAARPAIIVEVTEGATHMTARMRNASDEAFQAFRGVMRALNARYVPETKANVFPLRPGVKGTLVRELAERLPAGTHAMVQSTRGELRVDAVALAS